MMKELVDLHPKIKIELRMEMGNVSRQQPDQRVNIYTRRPPIARFSTPCTQLENQQQQQQSSDKKYKYMRKKRPQQLVLVKFALKGLHSLTEHPL